MGAANPLSRKQRDSDACKIGSCEPVSRRNTAGRCEVRQFQHRKPWADTDIGVERSGPSLADTSVFSFPSEFEFTQTASKSFLRQHYSLSMHTKLRGYGISPCVGSCRGRAEMSRNDPPWAALKGHLKQWTQTASTSRNWTEISQTRMDRPISSC